MYYFFSSISVFSLSQRLLNLAIHIAVDQQSDLLDYNWVVVAAMALLSVMKRGEVWRRCVECHFEIDHKNWIFNQIFSDGKNYL